MNDSHYRYQFPEGADMADVENTLLMAVIAAEGIHGRARVRIDADFDVDHDQRTCRVSSCCVAGESIARVFTEFLLLERGDDGFEVDVHRPVSRSDSSQNGEKVGR
ncbi:MAG: hypothetical protein GY856_44000 [bacterium]|nr:hypothetical protein [bacterium]